MSAHVEERGEEVMEIIEDQGEGQERRFPEMPVPVGRPMTFDLVRRKDHTGVSGEGEVACGVLFPDGTVVVQWQTYVRSVAIYSSLADVLYIHGHNEATGVRFYERPERLYYLAGGGWVYMPGGDAR